MTSKDGKCDKRVTSCTRPVGGELFAGYDHCEENGIGAYGGGQWELGPGRGHIQYLASIFHPDTPNDVAPSGYNTNGTDPDLPDSPLDPVPTDIGFRWRA